MVSWRETFSRTMKVGCLVFFVGLIFTLTACSGEYRNPVFGSNDPLTLGTPIFSKEPRDVYYIVKTKPVSIACQASPAREIKFKCAGQWMSPNRHTNLELLDPETGIKTLQTSFEVTREEVDEYFGKDGFWCECHARNNVPDTNTPDTKISSRASVVIAYLKRRFEREPINQKVILNSTAELRCLPPEGKPLPAVFWQKNGKMLDVYKDRNFIITSEGNLIINQARLSDMGNYTCGAQNDASRRLSDSAMLTIYVDGGWSSWGPWQDCSSKCGRGTQKKTRECRHPEPLNGGAPCQGNMVEKRPCSKICPVNGAWSSWSPWTTCDQDCTKMRSRKCDDPSPSNGGDGCFGNDEDTSDCFGGSCRESRKTAKANKPSQNIDYHAGGKKAKDRKNKDSSPTQIQPLDASAQGRKEATEADGNESIALYVGVCVAVAFCVIVVIVIILVIRRKHVREPDYVHRDYHSGDTNMSHVSEDGKLKGVQPDIMQAVVAIETGDKSPIYAEPIVSRSNQTTPLDDRSYATPLQSPFEMMNNGNVMHVDPYRPDSACDTTMDTENTGNSNQSVIMPPILPSNIDMDACAWASVNHNGGKLSIPESGICLTIPAGAIDRGHSEQVYVAVCHDDKDRPRLQDKQTILSPVVLCGPPGVKLKKPVVLSFQHCANIRQGGWLLSMYSSDRPQEESPQWQKLVAIGQENIDTPLYVQVDANHCHIMTDQLQRYTLIGEPAKGLRPVKILRLAAFAPTTPPSMDYNIRVYIVEDTQDALESVIQVERKLGGRLVEKPKQMPFQDGGNSLCLTIDELSPSWRSKLAANYQEIPFWHIWSGTQNNLHCSFSLELIDRSQNTLNCSIQAYQKSVITNRQVLHICVDLREELPQCVSPTSTLQKRTAKVQADTTSSSGFSSMITIHSAGQRFKLSNQTKSQLCMLLDPPYPRGNDWRMLAKALSLDRHLYFFAAKASPTEHILDLWEASHMQESAVTDLMNILRVMGRMDAANILEKDSGPWL